jgi:hypothetical protein
MEASKKRQPSPVIKNHPVYCEIAQEVVYQIYDYLDSLWSTTQFVPNPVPNVVEQFKSFRVTATHAVLIMLRWYESRMKDYIYGLKISEGV